jgi:hypothetical protein
VEKQDQLCEYRRREKEVQKEYSRLQSKFEALVDYVLAQDQARRA